MDHKKLIAMTFMGFGVFALLLMGFAFFYTYEVTKPQEPAKETGESVEDTHPTMPNEASGGETLLMDPRPVPESGSASTSWGTISLDATEILPLDGKVAVFFTLTPTVEPLELSTSSLRAFDTEGVELALSGDPSTFIFHSGEESSLEVNFEGLRDGLGVSRVEVPLGSETAVWDGGGSTSVERLYDNTQSMQ